MRVYPVVHINEPAIAITQARIALELGADGVYLINHHGQNHLSDVFDTFNKLDTIKPGSFIGVNLLGIRPLAACMILSQMRDAKAINRTPDGLWSDNALAETQVGETLAFKKRLRGMDGMRYLGGISFKYTKDFTEDPDVAYQLTTEALDRVDVVTTSGAGTGIPPTVDKIAAMYRVASGAKKPLAVASGIDSCNNPNHETP